MKTVFRSVNIRYAAAVVVLVLAGAAGLKSAGRSFFKRDDRPVRAADPAIVQFVKPGLMFSIASASIAQNGTITARVKVTDPTGLPLDRLGVDTPGTISMSFIAATIPQGQTQYMAYTVRTATAASGATAIQASSDTGGTLTANADGDYTYTFAAKAPAGYDATATHTIAVYGTRDLSAFNLGYNEASNAYSFVPNGAKVSVTRDVVRDAGCTRCHDVISYHGGSRVGTALCVLCHQPQTTDPTTGAKLDFPVLIHKIHNSSALTQDYAINGFTGLDTWGPDGTQVTFPPDGGNGMKNFITGKTTVNAGVLRCETCHDQSTGAAHADAYFTNPTQNACGACHDYVNFATGANHVNLPQPDNAQCKSCHTPQGELEFDASIKGAHIVPTESSQLPGINLTIARIQGTAGAKPVITYTVKDNAGNPIPLSKLNRLAGVLAGPTTDYGYTSFGSDVTTQGYVSEDLTQGSCGSDGTCTYTFLHAIPAKATGTYTIGLEGRMVGNLNVGTTKEIDGVEYGAKNAVMNFSVDGSAVTPRRTVVNLTQDCDRCHVKLSLHGENRNQIEMCVLCHNPSENDLSQRTSPPYLGTPPQGINFALLVHRIHSGSAQASFIGRPFTVVGFGASPVNFNKVVFPVFHNYQETETDDALNKCYICHSSGSYQNDIPNMANLNTVHDPQGIIPNSGPIAAACMGCHNEVSTGSHALANTTSLGEACAVCHGPTSDFAPQTVHIVNVEH